MASRVSKLLAKAYAGNNMLQADLARALGVLPSHLAHYKSGQRRITYEIAHRLSRHTGIPAIDWLYAQYMDTYGHQTPLPWPKVDP